MWKYPGISRESPLPSHTQSTRWEGYVFKGFCPQRIHLRRAKWSTIHIKCWARLERMGWKTKYTRRHPYSNTSLCFHIHFQICSTICEMRRGLTGAASAGPHRSCLRDTLKPIQIKMKRVITSWRKWKYNRTTGGAIAPRNVATVQ